ncbi:hypothetical protein Lal_00015165, partial [Lupinus albus]
LPINHNTPSSGSRHAIFPPLVSNCCAPRRAARFGMRRSEAARTNVRGAKKAQLPNLMRHRVRTAGNRSMGMGGRLILLQPQGWLIVRSWLEDPWFWKAHESERYVECATDTTLRRYLCRGGIAQLFLEEGWFARVTDPAIMYSYLHAPATEIEHTYDDLHA